MESNLIQVRNDEILTTSLVVAEKFSRRHEHVIRAIENLVSQITVSPNLGTLSLFEKTQYQHEQNGQYYPMYYMNRDGFTLLAMGFTGKAALEWKLKYIAAFNEMERRLRGQTSQTPTFNERLTIAKLISRTPVRNVQAVKDLFPEYFTPINSLEYASDVNTSYRRWIDDYGITTEWIVNFPTTDIYLNYVRYCTENRIPSMGKKIFYRTLEIDFNLSRTQKSDGHRYFLTA